jgi:hypothetical protein
VRPSAVGRGSTLQALSIDPLPKFSQALTFFRYTCTAVHTIIGIELMLSRHNKQVNTGPFHPPHSITTPVLGGEKTSRTESHPKVPLSQQCVPSVACRGCRSALCVLCLKSSCAAVCSDLADSCSCLAHGAHVELNRRVVSEQVLPRSSPMTWNHGMTLVVSSARWWLLRRYCMGPQPRSDCKAKPPRPSPPPAAHASTRGFSADETPLQCRRNTASWKPLPLFP